MFESIFNDIKIYLKKTKIPLVNYIFLLECLFLVYYPNSKNNLLYWNNVDFGKIFYSIGTLLYNSNSIYIFCVIVLSGCGFAWIDYKNWLAFLNKSSEYVDGTTHGFSLLNITIRMIMLAWNYIHEGWIIYLLVVLASGQKGSFYSDLMHPSVEKVDLSMVYWLFIIINGCYVIWTIFYAFGSFEINAIYIGKYIEMENTGYFKIDQIDKYCFIKDQIQKPTLFYLVYERKPQEYIIEDYSKSFDEIKYEFEIKTKKASCSVKS